MSVLRMPGGRKTLSESLLALSASIANHFARTRYFVATLLGQSERKTAARVHASGNTYSYPGPDRPSGTAPGATPATIDDQRPTTIGRWLRFPSALSRTKSPFLR